MPGPRPAAIASLRERQLDALIIGGGINGAGLLRDLSLRGGIHVGLIEKNHFGAGTSGKNSHLIHGGLRYLKYFDFGLVREALRERSILLHNAGQYVEPLEFLLPFRSQRDRLIYRAGLSLYGMLSSGSDLPRPRGVSRRELYRTEPGLRKSFVSAAAYYDARVEAARLVLANITDAMRRGAQAANYVEMRSCQRRNGGWQVVCHDRISGEEFDLSARLLVDATGAWTRQPGVRLVRGSHIVVPRLNRSDSAIAYFEPSGRIVFFIPWGLKRQATLVGTTEADHAEGPDSVTISAAETSYLRAKVQEVFNANPEPISTFSSLRPLVHDPSRSATATSREHKIWFDQEGVLHISGGKYTTYRLIAEQAAAMVCYQIAPVVRYRNLTSRTPFLPILKEDDEIIAHAARNEMAQWFSDLMYVSTTWGYERRWSYEELLPLARRFGQRLDWNESRVEQEARSFVETGGVV